MPWRARRLLHNKKNHRPGTGRLREHVHDRIDTCFERVL